MRYLTRPAPSNPLLEASDERQEYAKGGRVEFDKGGIKISPTTEQKDIAKKIYGKDFEELTTDQRFKIRKGVIKLGSFTFEQYLEDYKNMTDDSSYKPKYIKPAIAKGLSAEQRRARIVASQSIEGFNEKLSKNINKNKKLKRRLDPEKRELDLSRSAERRDRKRIKEKDVALSPRESQINLEQRKFQKSINEVIRKNPNLILDNKDLMDKLSITISKEGDIIKVPTTINEKSLKERGLFEIDHQRDIYKEGRGKNLPYNRNLILGPYNRAGGFKDAAEKFIEKNSTSDKIPNIIEKAKELKITLQPNVPEGTFKTKGIGYKQIADPIEKFKDVAKPITNTFKTNTFKLFSDPTGIGAALDTPFGQTLSKKVPNFVKGVARVSTLTGTPFAALMGVAMYSGDLKEKGTSDLEALGYSALKGTTQDLLNFGDLLIRKLPVATYEKFVEKKPFLESLLGKPEYFTFVDDFVDKQIEKMSTVEKIDNRAKLAARKEIPNIISDTEVPDPRTTEEFNESIQKNKKAILDADPLVKKLYEKEMAAPKEVKPDPSKTSTILGPIVFPKYTSEQLNLASGGPAKFKTELEDDLYIAPLPKSNPTPKEGILNLKFDREDD